MMKKTNVIAAAIIASALSLPALADISISGDGRYRFGIKDKGLTAAEQDQNYRDGRMRITIKGGSQNNGIEMRARQKFGGSATQDLKVDRMRAFTKLGGVTLTMGNQGQYTGLLGTYYDSEGGVNQEFSGDGAITLSGGNSTFNGFLTHETHNKPDLKSDGIRYGLNASFQGINVNYVARPSDLVKDSTARTFSTAAFQDITVGGTFAGTLVEINSATSDAADQADVTIGRLSIPVGGLTLKIGYAELEPFFQNQDAGTVLGEKVFGDDGYGPTLIDGSGVAGKTNTYTGIALAGSMGNISYQLTTGTYEDNDATTSNSFYDINATYTLDASTSINIGMGRAQGLSGVGIHVDYSF